MNESVTSRTLQDELRQRRPVAPDQVERLLLEELGELGPVFVEVVSLAFAVGVP